MRAEYAHIRAFTLLPGIVESDLQNKDYALYAQDEAELTGALSLYLATARAEYLRNSLTSVNWDLEEMESHKAEIEQGLLKVKWVAPLPCSGGSGL